MKEIPRAVQISTPRRGARVVGLMSEMTHAGE